nr:DUF2306 domain-containing protein [Alteromonas facilis]
MFSSLLIFHIFSGAVALLAGYSVIVIKKGGTAHKYLGRSYVIAMLALGLTGTFIAVSREVPLSILNGLVLCYFVLSALNLMWQPPRNTNVWDKILFAFVLLITSGFAWFAYQASKVEGGQLGGFGIQAYLVFGSVMLFCCIGDARYLKRGGLNGKSRLVRHLWRMFFPLLMSTAAFFLGQTRHLPEALQNIGYLLAPVVIVLGTMIYWILKLRTNTLAHEAVGHQHAEQ